MTHIEELVKVHDELHQWCMTQWPDPMEPVLPEIAICGYASAVSIEGMTLWDSESGYSVDGYEGEPLTSGTCIKVWRAMIKKLYRPPGAR